jgi:ATP-dependent RNA helicase DDX19/DBP5
MNPNPNKEIEDEEEEIENKQFIGLNDIQINEFLPEKIDYLKSKKTWEELELDPKLIDVLTTKGFKKPSFIQQNVIIMSKKNTVLAQSQNGSGKTLAYLIPCIRELETGVNGTNEFGNPCPQIIILGDTKALILQVHKILRDILDNYEGYQKVTTDYLFGGKSEIAKNVQILLCTIAQLKKCVTKKTMSVEKIKMIAVDEADHVFESDLGKTFFGLFINKILKRDDYKMLFTSATMTEDFQKVMTKIKEKRNILSIDLPVEKLTLQNVQQFMIKFKSIQQKKEILESVIQKLNAQNILVFGNNRKRLLELKEYLCAKNYKVAFVYKDGDSKGVESAEFLEEQIKDFLAGKYRILLTTNLLSRGIDMRKVTLVINYSLPLKFHEDKNNKSREIDLETYLHRVGRTGRFGDQGIALNFVDAIKDISLIQNIQDFYKNEIRDITIEHLDDVNKILEKISEVNKEKREYLEENI